MTVNCLEKTTQQFDQFIYYGVRIDSTFKFYKNCLFVDVRKILMENNLMQILN